MARTRRLSVAVLNQFALPREQGGGTRHIDLFGRLRNWSPMIIAGNRNHYSQATFVSRPPFRLVRVPAADGGWRSRLVSWASYSFQSFIILMTKRDLDVIYASTPHLLAPLVGALVSRLRRVPLVLEVRDLWPESIVSAGAVRAGSRVHRALEWLERYVVRAADSVVVVTTGWEDHFAELGVGQDRLTVIPNGTETSDFAVDEARDSLRTQYGLTGYTAVFAGAHGPKDGIDYILEAARQLPDVHFLLVGDGPAKPDAQLAAAHAGLRNVRFMDAVPKNELPRLLHGCDVGIHTVTPLPVFLRGMSPNKLFDYLAAGLPVASNAGRALDPVLLGREVGAVQGPEGLADALIRVRSATQEEHESWRDTARELLEHEFSRSAAASKLETVLDTVRYRRKRAGRR